MKLKKYSISCLLLFIREKVIAHLSWIFIIRRNGVSGINEDDIYLRNKLLHQSKWVVICLFILSFYPPLTYSVFWKNETYLHTNKTRYIKKYGKEIYNRLICSK